MNKVINFFKSVFSNLGAILGMLATGVMVVLLFPVFILTMGVAAVVDFVQNIKISNNEPELSDEDFDKIIEELSSLEQIEQIESQHKFESAPSETKATGLVRKMVKSQKVKLVENKSEETTDVEVDNTASV